MTDKPKSIRSDINVVLKKYPKQIFIGSIIILAISVIYSGVMMFSTPPNKNINERVKNFDSGTPEIGKKWQQREYNRLEDITNKNSALQMYQDMQIIEELKVDLDRIRNKKTLTLDDSLKAIELYNKIQKLKTKYE